MALKKLLTRSISGLVYIAIILAGIYFGIDGLTVLAILFGVLATIEFHTICHDLTPRTFPCLLLDIAGVIGIIMMPLEPGLAILLWLIVLILRLVAELYVKADNPVNNLAHSFMSQLYIGIPLALMAAVAMIAGSAGIMLAIFIFLWLNDTGAFLVGSAIGRHRLFERISPKKSWEGFWGGLICNVIAALLFSIYSGAYFPLPHNYWIWIGLAAIVSVFGTWGDLVESMIKRNLKIKDLGHIIPGHGGILDRIDSLLLVMPAVFLYLMFLLMFY